MSFQLSTLFIKKLAKPGLYGDRVHNLYFQVAKTGTKSWIFRYMLDGRRRSMGLGPYPAVSLARAREKARDLYRQIKESPEIDPVDDRILKRKTAKQKQSQVVTFQWCAEQYIEVHRHAWRNSKHIQQWTNSLTAYAFPVIGDLAVNEINTGLVMQVLTPIWQNKNETANRVRGRIENILDWATTHDYRQGENPARWKGHIDNLLPRIKRNNHFKALPYKEINEFITRLRLHSGVSASALEFLILTAARTGEIRFSTWNEIDSNLWIIPAERMKAEREHRIPLTNRAIELLNSMAEIRQSDYIFPGMRSGRPISNAAMDKLLQQTLGYSCTVHGFRSTFRDWAGEMTHYPRDLCEMALAHTIKNKAEAAYRRGDMLAKRRNMMNDWLKFCEMPLQNNGNVAEIFVKTQDNGANDAG